MARSKAKSVSGAGSEARRKQVKSATKEKAQAPAERGLEPLLEFIQQSRGFDFTAYKRNTLSRRIEKRLQEVKIKSYDDYIDYLEVHPEEFGLLFNTILINVTGFFRDSATWDEVKTRIIPRVLGPKPAEDPIRIWSAGCASGEEAYSLAMLLAEALGPTAFRSRVKIYGTDVDDEALNQARQATYTAKQVEDVPREVLGKYFRQYEDRYIFDRDLRRSVIFGRHDLIQDAPISRVDMVSCRNTLMYFNSEAQTKILQRFAFALNDGGILMLGRAETLLTRLNVFAPVDLKRRIFAKAPRTLNRERMLPPAFAENNQGNHGNGDIRLRQAAQDADIVAQIGIDTSGNLVLVNDAARSLFNIANLDVGRPLQDLEISYRPAELRSVLEEAYKNKRSVSLHDVEYALPGGNLPRRFFDLTVIPLFDNGGEKLGAKVIYTDVTRYRQLQEDLQQSQQELETAYEELQSANEELETTNEELQSTVEELETTNEELKSTNEELETMNEELQSTNEELQATNDELRERSDELADVNSFNETILSRMQEGMIALDPDMRVTAWNERSEDMWGLRRDEVLGRHLMNLDSGLPVDQLRAPARAILAGETENQESQFPATNRRGRPVHIGVKMIPLGGADGAGRGLLMIVTELKQD